MDGKTQRRALSAAESALRALGKGDVDGARRAASKAVELDQVGAFRDLDLAVERGAVDLETGGEVAPEAWDAIAETVGPGPLAALVEAERG